MSPRLGTVILSDATAHTIWTAHKCPSEATLEFLEDMVVCLSKEKMNYLNRLVQKSCEEHPLVR